MTKVMFNPKQQRVPAGLITGIEAFWHNDEKWVIANGTASRFADSPSVIQQIIFNAFRDDTASLTYLKKMGLSRFSEVFDTWYRCVIGGLDHVPDFDGPRLEPDSYNNMCADLQCPHRGRLCSRAAGLKNFEVETIVALRNGESLERTASKLCLSIPGMKSRVEHLKDNLHVLNMAALMAMTAELGI